MMKVTFKDGTVRNCTPPTEQKVFKSGEAAGWFLFINLIGENTSDELDSFVTADNVSDLIFTPDETDKMTETLKITGYGKISSALIRYAEDVSSTRVEIQLSKGV